MVKPQLDCGGPAISLADWFWPRGSSIGYAESWPQLQGRTVIGTHRGRTAIYLACRLLGLDGRDEILVPTYSCGTELDALLQAGLNLIGYRVTKQCEIDLDDLTSKKSNRTRAVYLIHYFGWEQPMTRLKRWCDENGLLLIEDCALALFSTGSTGSIGQTGHAAIYSLPKSLGFVQGGLLSLADPPSSKNLSLISSGAMTRLREIRHSVQSVAVRGLKQLGLYEHLASRNRHYPMVDGCSVVGAALPDMPPAYYFNAKVDADRALDPRVERILNSLQWEEVIRQRRRNYKVLVSELGGVERLQPLFRRLPEGVCPLALPLAVPNRDQLASSLRKRGVAAYPWWAGFHQRGIEWEKFEEACWLKQNLITIPVYQGIPRKVIGDLAEAIKDAIHECE